MSQEVYSDLPEHRHATRVANIKEVLYNIVFSLLFVAYAGAQMYSVLVAYQGGLQNYQYFSLRSTEYRRSAPLAKFAQKTTLPVRFVLAKTGWYKEDASHIPYIDYLFVVVNAILQLAIFFWVLKKIAIILGLNRIKFFKTS